MHSTVTQKQSIDSMTLPRCQSFKMQPSNQFKLKSNFRSNSGTFTQCHQQSTIGLSIDHIDDATIKNCNIPLKKNRSIKSEYAIYEPEINSNTFHVVKNESTSIDENQIESTEMVSIAPTLNIETNANKFRLTMQSPNTQQTHVRRIKPICYSKLRRSTAQPIRSWLGWFRPRRNTAFYSPPFEHPSKSVKIQLHSNEYPKGVRNKCNAIEAAIDTSTAVINCVDNNNTSSNDDDEDISNSSLQNVDSMALKDELAAYMDEIRAREKR